MAQNWGRAWFLLIIRFKNKPGLWYTVSLADIHHFMSDQCWFNGPFIPTAALHPLPALLHPRIASVFPGPHPHSRPRAAPPAVHRNWHAQTLSQHLVYKGLGVHSWWYGQIGIGGRPPRASPSTPGKALSK